MESENFTFTAMALLLSGILAFQCSRQYTASVLFSFAILSHKAMWPFAALIMLTVLYKQRQLVLKNIVLLMIAGAPLLIIWILGTFHTGHPDWMLSTVLKIGVQTRETLPVFEGIISTIISGGIKSLFKGGLILFLFIISIILLIFTYKQKPPCYQLSIAICIVCIFWFAFLTHVEIWAAVRFSRMLTLPLFWLLGYLYKNKDPKWLNPTSIIIVFSVLFSTQLVFAWYQAEIFYHH